MTEFAEQLQKFVGETYRTNWTEREGRVVPDVDSLPFKNEAITFESATVLYADLAESTALVRKFKPFFAADIYKNYLYCAGRIIEKNEGHITAYDGDRVMAVFLGGHKNSNAARCALGVNYAVKEIIQPAIKAVWPDQGYVIRQKIGIDTSQLFVAKTGVRGASDLVWVGNAANNAAKMAAMSTASSSYISEDVYTMLHDWAKFGGEPEKNMWTDLGSEALGFKVYGSNWQWSI
jgi:class 3 adenylate cyclase